MSVGIRKPHRFTLYYRSNLTKAGHGNKKQKKITKVMIINNRRYARELIIPNVLGIKMRPAADNCFLLDAV